LLASTAAAGGIAFINSFGNLSGWLGPFVVGWLKDLTGATSARLYVVAGLEVLAAALILLFTPRRMAQIGMCQQRHGGRWRLLNGRGGRK
jgi:cyanate permease